MTPQQTKVALKKLEAIQDKNCAGQGNHNAYMVFEELQSYIDDLDTEFNLPETPDQLYDELRQAMQTFIDAATEVISSLPPAKPKTKKAKK